jgi:hypothetical protein
MVSQKAFCNLPYFEVICLTQGLTLQLLFINALPSCGSLVCGSPRMCPSQCIFLVRFPRSCPSFVPSAFSSYVFLTCPSCLPLVRFPYAFPSYICAPHACPSCVTLVRVPRTCPSYSYVPLPRTFPSYVPLVPALSPLLAHLVHFTPSLVSAELTRRRRNASTCNLCRSFRPPAGISL